MELIAFDLDGTLTESKQILSEKMAEALCILLNNKKVAVMSGASFEQFEKQFLPYIKCANEECLMNLYVFASNGNELYIFKEGEWRAQYRNMLTVPEKEMIFESFRKNFGISRTEEKYGLILEDRDSQITYSGLGQKAPLQEKLSWDSDFKKRMEITKKIKGDLSGFEIKIGGYSSIDISKKGMNKATALLSLKIPKEQIFFVGDALFLGGNDYSIIEEGISSKRTSGPKETLAIINSIINP